MRGIIIKFENAGEVVVEFIDKNKKTQEAIIKALPFESEANLWGEEVYFSTPVSVDLESPQEVVKVGDVGYWPPGKAICLFFGLTPISTSINEIKPASPVNVFGRIVKGLDVLRKVREGEKIKVLPLA